MGQNKYTDKELLKELQRLDDEFDGDVSTQLIEDEAKAATHTYHRHFGGIPDARQEAGIKCGSGHEIRNRASYVRVSDDELLDELERLAGELGRPPSTTEVRKKGEYHDDTYRDRFGSISEAREEAGLAGDYPFTSEKLSKEKVTRVCQECGKEESVWPCRQNQKYCSMKCMGKSQREYTAQEIRTKLKSLTNSLGRPPTTSEFYDTFGIWHHHFEYYDGLNSFSQELRDLGFDAHCAQDLSPEELLDDLKRIGSMLDRVPRLEDIKEHGKCNSAGPFRTHFGGFLEALTEAGFCIPGAQRREIKESELISEFNRLADELGNVPSYNDIREESNFSASTYENTFGSFLLAKKAAGFPPQPSRHNLPSGEDHYAWKGGVDPNYGDNWREQRKKARRRDEFMCQRCGIQKDEHLDKFGTLPHVHHITPWDEFESSEKRNALSNLVTLCASCHKRIESLPVTPEFEVMSD